MKFKKTLISFIVFILLGSTYYFIAKSKYELSDEYEQFPIPKNAKLIKEENDYSSEYEWSKASDVNGIPLSYRIIITTNGWEGVLREGSLTTYEKEGIQINLSIYRDAIVIDKVNY
jgi:hypothetical protein